MPRLPLCLLLAAMPLPALADTSAELDALTLADTAVSQPQSDSPLHGQLQLSRWQGSQWQGFASVRLDSVLQPGWRVVLADRVDFRPQAGGPAQVNSLQEAYLSWQPSPAQALDMGRINPRSGVALGFNPLDVWRDSGLRAAASADPASARDNRLGVVMLRAQQLYDGGSVGVLLAPALASAANSAPWSPDWGSSNRRERWQLQASVAGSGSLRTQWLLAGGAGETLQPGVAASLLLGDATTVYGEASASRRHDLAAGGARRWRALGVLGLGYTAATRLTLHAEWHYNGQALAAADWAALQGQAYGRYRQAAQQAALAPTRQQWFLHAEWQDFLRPGLVATAMLRHDRVDDSRFFSTGLRWQGDRLALGVNAERGLGRLGSHYGGQALRWQLFSNFYY